MNTEKNAAYSLSEESISFASPLDSALDSAFFPFSSPVSAFTVVPGPEENAVFFEVLRKDHFFPRITAEGKKRIKDASAGEIFAIENPDFEAVFRVTETDGGEEENIYFHAESVDSGLVVTVLANPSEASIIEVFPVNYSDDAETEDFYFTRVYYRTAGLQPRERYREARFFDIASNGSEVLTVADLEERRRADTEALRGNIREEVGAIRARFDILDDILTGLLEEADNPKAGIKTLTRYDTFLREVEILFPEG